MKELSSAKKNPHEMAVQTKNPILWLRNFLCPSHAVSLISATDFPHYFPIVPRTPPCVSSSATVKQKVLQTEEGLDRG